MTHETSDAVGVSTPDGVEITQQPARQIDDDTTASGRQWRAGDLVAHGDLYPPAGRRRHAAVIVEHCPRCAAMHRHSGAQTGDLKRGSCGALYRLLVRYIPVQGGGEP